MVLRGPHPAFNSVARIVVSTHLLLSSFLPLVFDPALGAFLSLSDKPHPRPLLNHSSVLFATVLPLGSAVHRLNAEAERVSGLDCIAASGVGWRCSRCSRVDTVQHYPLVSKSHMPKTPPPRKKKSSRQNSTPTGHSDLEKQPTPSLGGYVFSLNQLSASPPASLFLFSPPFFSPPLSLSAGLPSSALPPTAFFLSTFLVPEEPGALEPGSPAPLPPNDMAGLVP